MPHRDENRSWPVPALSLIVDDDSAQPLRYALEQLTEFCNVSPQIDVHRRSRWEKRPGVTVFVGRGPAERHLPEACRDVAWESLGSEGFVLRSVLHRGEPAIIAAGYTDAGTRHAVYALMCRLDVTSPVPTLPADMNLIERPSFNLRGMYAHQHWAYNHPYALRTWTVDEWRQYVDILALMRVNLFQIWSMAGILQYPLSPGDRAFLERYPPVIDHARDNHGMEVYIGECANNTCRPGDVPPIADRLYFDVECLKDPRDPQQMADLRAQRADYYHICNNAHGYWVLDSDPGQWEGSPASDFVDILMMNRRLISEHAKLGAAAKLIYWMWFGWGTKEREDNWRDIVAGLIRHAPEPWCMTAAWEGHWKVVDEFGLEDRVIYFPYGAVEPEPSLPFTTVVPQVINEVLDVPERVGRICGIMGNAQTPLCQLPNMHYFTRAVWDMNLRHSDRQHSVAELARLIYPEHAGLVTRCWMSISSADAPHAAELSDELEALCNQSRLGRPGPIGVKLFPDFAQVARDLAVQLRIHGVAMDFCRMAGDAAVSETRLLDQLKRYCMLSLAWRRQNGFRRYGTNGYNFFPLREAAHRHWWRSDHLDTRVYAELEAAMRTEYEQWEAELVLYPLNH